MVLRGGRVHGSAVHGHAAHVIRGAIQTARESASGGFLEAAGLGRRPGESQAWETGRPPQAAPVAVAAVAEEESRGAEGEAVAVVAVAAWAREEVLEEDEGRGGKEGAGVHRTVVPRRTARQE